MIRFTLFGIPVEIHPFFWVILAMLGGVLGADTSTALLEVCLFVLAGLVSILVHEFGHALTGRKLGGGHASILLWSFGGLATNRGGRFTRNQLLAMVAAGPGAGFAFLLVILAVLSAFFGLADTLSMSGLMLFGRKPEFQSLELILFLSHKPLVADLIYSLLQINFWWGVINLLPVLPLDGGRIAELFVRPQKRVFQIGLVTSAIVAVFVLAHFGSSFLYTAAVFGYLGWKNYQNMREVRWQ